MMHVFHLHREFILFVVILYDRSSLDSRRRREVIVEKGIIKPKKALGLELSTKAQCQKKEEKTVRLLIFIDKFCIFFYWLTCDELM